MKNTTHHNTDVVIIGSGAAGLSLALSLANHCKVTVISKGALKEGSTLYAQGGIAAVFDKKNDSIESHVEDTLAAGAGLCDRDAVHYTASNAKNCLKWLIEQGVPFDMEVDSKGKRQGEHDPQPPRAKSRSASQSVRFGNPYTHMEGPETPIAPWRESRGPREASPLFHRRCDGA